MSATQLDLLFIACDVLTALFLSLSSYAHQHDMFESEKKRTSKLKMEDCREVIVNDSNDSMMTTSSLVACLYLLSPFSIIACVARSTGVIHNMLIAFAIVLSNGNMRFLAMAVSSLLAYQSLHSVMLLPALILTIEMQRKGSQVPDYSSRSVICSIFLSVILFSMFFAALIQVSHILTGSWHFFSSTFLFQLTVPDLTPNIGFFWYFFTEMFEHFRSFFLVTFQINSFIYTIPLTVTLRRSPSVLLFVQLILLSLLKPYPSVSDLTLYLSIIPTYQAVMRFTNYGLVISCTIVSCSVLAPLVWHLWIMTGAANSNFYFGVTLAYNTAQILLATDVLLAFNRRDFYLDNGIPKDDEGNPKRLELVCD